MVTHRSQKRMPMNNGANSDAAFDFIVCGAGSAGCVVAARMAADPAVRVLLLEAGGTDDVPEVMVPGMWPQNLGSVRDWGFAAQPNRHLNGRAIPMNMGKVLGGGSSINVMVWARGHKSDWDDFAEASGDPAWGYESVLDIYRRVENWQGPEDAARRGRGGPVHVGSAVSPQAVAVAMVEAARDLGLPAYDSPNGAMMEGRGGAAINDLIVRDGRRSSIFDAYLRPMAGRTNLTILTGALVSRLLFRGNAVIGVEAVCEGKSRRFFADREVVLSMGAVQTPKVLMQSGIGPEAELARHGISTVVNLPGVGQNHQDHVAFGCVFEYTEPQPVGHGGSEATLYWKSRPDLRLPDMFHCQLEFPVASPETIGEGFPEHGWTMFAGLAHPKSRGQLRLSGPGADDPVLIEANMLSDPDDLRMALENIELCRSIGWSAPMQELVKREALPGKLDRGALENFARNAAVTYWHQSCTAKMGMDTMSVVDARLRVYGLQNLRIADASILPHITSGNIMAPCVVIGERAADLLKATHHLSAA